MKKNMLNINSNRSDFNMDDLELELVKENNFLTKLVDTIPAKMYFDQEIQEKITVEKHSTVNKAVEDIKRKSSNLIKLSAKGKHKRARLNPLTQKSVSQIHEELNKKKQKRVKKQKGPFVPSPSLTRAVNIEELQKRLQERISFFQAKRKAAANDPETKRKLKIKVKKLKQKGNLMKAREISKPEKSIEKPKHSKSDEKPVFNKEGNFLYSKFQFSEDGKEDTKKNEYAGKKIKHLLKKAEKKKEKIENVKNIDPDKGQLLEEKEKWKKAILKTEGVKVKDDPSLLKKSLKRGEKQKKKSAKVWKSRIEETEKRKKECQEKRNRNIKQKKKEKLEHKIKLAKKKGRVITGF